MIFLEDFYEISEGMLWRIVMVQDMQLHYLGWRKSPSIQCLALTIAPRVWKQRWSLMTARWSHHQAWRRRHLVWSLRTECFFGMTARCPHLPKQGMSLIEALSHAFPKSSCLLFCCESLADPPWASRMWPQIGNLTVALWRLRRANMTGTHLPFDIFSRMWLDEFQILQETKMLGTGQWRCSRTRWRCSKTSSAGGHCRGAVYLLEVGGSKKKRRNSTELKKAGWLPLCCPREKRKSVTVTLPIYGTSINIILKHKNKT